MLAKSCYSAAAMAISVSGFVIERAVLHVPQGPDKCPESSNNQTFLADIGYYSDKECTQKIGYVCDHGYTTLTHPGDYQCGVGFLPDHSTPIWAKNLFSPSNLPDIQILYTQDQICPPTGPGAVYATLTADQNCVQLNKDGSIPGVTIYPHGGAAVTKRDAAPKLHTVKRANPKCTGFNKNGDGKPSESRSVQVSSIVDCTNGAESGCTISKGDQHTESVTTMYSATAGGGIEGVFMVSATFGMSYESSETTTEQESLTVPQGQKGYIAAYCAATLFDGTFTGCVSGPAEQPGQALVLKSNGFTYSVVTTGA